METDTIKAALAAIHAEHRAAKAHAHALAHRDRAIHHAYQDHEELSQAELARRLGINKNTFRSIIRPVRRESREEPQA